MGGSKVDIQDISGTGNHDRSGLGGLALWAVVLLALASLAMSAWSHQDHGQRLADHQRRLQRTERAIQAMGPRVLSLAQASWHFAQKAGATD